MLEFKIRVKLSLLLFLLICVLFQLFLVVLLKDLEFAGLDSVLVQKLSKLLILALVFSLEFFNFVDLRLFEISNVFDHVGDSLLFPFQLFLELKDFSILV